LWQVPDLVLRAIDATWDVARWEQLPADGNRYAVIDGVLSLSTAPSAVHPWVVRQLARLLRRFLDDRSQRCIWPGNNI
jgi:hypothetical protein